MFTWSLLVGSEKTSFVAAHERRVKPGFERERKEKERFEINQLVNREKEKNGEKNGHD